MNSRAKIWFHAARPKTLGAAIAPVMIGSALAFADGKFQAAASIAALLVAVSIQIATNFCNDYCDFKKGADKERIGPVRATQAGLVTPQAMKMATIFAFAFAVASSVYLILRSGWPIMAIGVASILSGIAYTAGPKPLAYIGLGDLFVLIFFGPVAVAGTYFVQALHVTPAALIAGISPGLLAVGILVANNLRDMEGDARAGKRTLAVRFGATFTRWQYTFCIFAGCTISPVVNAVFFNGRPACLASACAMVSAFPTLRLMWSREGAALNPVLGQTGKVLLFYAAMYSVGCIV